MATRIEEILPVLSCAKACLAVVASCRLLAVYTHTHTYGLCCLTKHLFPAHMYTLVGHPPYPQPRKVSGFFDVGPIDQHYYCSLLIPLEIRPVAQVLGD